MFTGRYPKHPLTHTASAPSIPATVAANGNHDNKDYDAIYENVMNFGLKSNGDLHRDNNNTHKALTKSTSVLVNRVSKVENDNVKVNGNYRNSFHGDFDVKAKDRSEVISERIAEEPEANKENGSFRHSVHDIHFSLNPEHGSNHGNGIEVVQEEMPVPPKRPLRKKKSMRGKEDVSRTSSNSSQERGRANSAASGSLAMEYLSDSSDFSPRDSSSVGDRKGSVSSVKSGGPVTSIQDRLGEGSPGALRHVEDTAGGGNNGVIVKSEDITVSRNVNGDQNSCDTDTVLGGNLKIGLNNNVVKDSKHSGIVDLWPDAGETLEVEKVEFSSHPSNFKQNTDSNFSDVDSNSQSTVVDVLENKLASKLGKISAKYKDINSEDMLSEQPLSPNNQKHSFTAVSDKPLVEDVSGPERGSQGSEPAGIHGNLTGGGAAQRFSSSMESLDEIDKILKEQVRVVNLN